ncbi:MAG: NAD(P)-binding domain-containing protein, partial [Roseovarius sp.]|nr:NAD(P)-binding domain-containing protein [Roseovarius sp.]
MRLGILGTGSIAEAVVRGLAPDGHQITVSERSAVRAARLAEAFETVSVAGNQGVVDASEVVFLGLMAEQAAEVLGGLRFRADQRVVSFMAGMPIEEVAALVAPAQAVAVMLPYPGIAQGGSPILALGDVGVIEDLFAPANTVYALHDAADLEAYLCAQAVLSPAV